MPNYTDLEGRVALISGAGGALGSAVAKRLAAEGVRLALLDRRQESLDALAAQLGSATPNPLLCVADITKMHETKRIVGEALAHFGRLDILINIAGGFIFSGPVHQMDVGDLDKMLDMNLRTAFLISAAAAKAMVAQKTGGRILNIGTRGALTGASGMAAYAASKAGVLRLTESMAAELLEEGITVNAVLPSVIDTPANRHAMPQSDFDTWVSPDSIAGVIAFLVSDAAKDISGAAIPVYGKA